MKTKLLRKARKDADNRFRIIRVYNDYGYDLFYRIQKIRVLEIGIVYDDIAYSTDHDYILKTLDRLKRGYILNKYLNCKP